MSRSFMRAWLVSVWLFAAPVECQPAPRRPNVLYIVVDDLRAELPMYGHRHVVAPNLEKFANESLVFTRAYCNQPVCSPSRNSFLTGRRPLHTRIWNFLSDFRETGPQWTTLPSHFKSQGYLTLGTGKLYHEGHPQNGDGAASWSNISQQFSCNHSTSGAQGGMYCDPNMVSCHVNGTKNAPNPRWCDVDAPMDGSGPEFFEDIFTVQDAMMKLHFATANLERTGQPFFLGIGLRKPHLDWRVPKGFLDLYPALADVPLARHRTAQPGRPSVSIHGPWRSAMEQKQWEGWGYSNPWTPMVDASEREMRVHYWAATSFMDAIVGQLLDGLEGAGAANDTIVAFHSDHGWSLGENGDWRKFSLTELGTRVPLIVRVPWLPHTAGARSDALVELVDVMPTLSDLAGLPRPLVRPGEAPLDGASLLPLFSERPPASVKTRVLAEYPRCPTHPDEPARFWENNWCIQVSRERFGYMGYSLRTADWRYTAWLPWNGSSLQPILPESPVNGSGAFYNELFSYSGGLADLDQLELREEAPQQPEVVARLHGELLELLGLAPAVELV